MTTIKLNYQHYTDRLPMDKTPSITNKRQTSHKEKYQTTSHLQLST